MDSGEGVPWWRVGGLAPQKREQQVQGSCGCIGVSPFKVGWVAWGWSRSKGSERRWWEGAGAGLCGASGLWPGEVLCEGEIGTHVYLEMPYWQPGQKVGRGWHPGRR